MTRHAVQWTSLVVCGLAATAAQAAVINFDTTAQQPLEAHDNYVSHQGPIRAGSSASTTTNGPAWQVYPQDDRTCAANTTHFTGRIPVTPDKELFFWFAESRGSPLADPTILWLNGGPGGSSMPGFFQEIGPCDLLGVGNETTTTANPDSWANFANLLVLDQPAGTGFSTAAGDSAPITLAQATVDFGAFVDAFVARFPAYFRHGFYVAGESFGGRYAPRYVADIMTRRLQQQHQQQQEHEEGEEEGVVPVKIDGLILADPFIDGVSHMLGHHELFCTDEYQDLLRFDETTCAAMEAAIPVAEHLLAICQETYDPEDCGAATEYAAENIERYFRDEEAKGKYSPYDLRLPCDLPDKSCIQPSQFYTEPYLNRPDILKLLGFDLPHEYRAVNFSLNAAWSEQPDILIPSTRNVSWLLDDGDLRILVFNGVYDAAITTPGIFREFDQLPWSQKDAFQKEPKGDWYWTDYNGNSIKGGKIKGLPKLQVASVYDAGHMSPGDAKPAVSSLVQQWIQS